MQAPLGPPIYENWRAFDEHSPKLASFEYPFFTDARIVGADADFGPFKLFNPLAPEGPTETARPALVLRYHLFINMMMYHERASENTDVNLYHGGQVTDEVAALISLTSAMRLKAGGESRRFEGEDLAGRPIAIDPRKEPQLLTSHGPRIIEPAIGLFVANRDLLMKIPRMAVDDVIPLLRAARLYQDGIWIAESEPNLAWLMLVSAVETAAIRWRAATESPEERLEASRPELATKLRELGGDDALQFVAAEIADSLGSTRKFVDFISTFLPELPPKRPPESEQCAWSTRGLKRPLQQIYGYRSAALHTGKPFPAPLCRAPSRENDWDAPAERPSSDRVRAMGGTWNNKDLPMYLHTFNYIARGSILNWWRSLAG